MERATYEEIKKKALSSIRNSISDYADAPEGLKTFPYGRARSYIDAYSSIGLISEAEKIEFCLCLD